LAERRQAILTDNQRRCPRISQHYHCRPNLGKAASWFNHIWPDPNSNLGDKPMHTEITITASQAMAAMVALYQIAGINADAGEGETDALIAVADALSDADRIVIDPEE